MRRDGQRLSSERVKLDLRIWFTTRQLTERISPALMATSQKTSTFNTSSSLEPFVSSCSFPRSTRPREPIVQWPAVTTFPGRAATYRELGALLKYADKLTSSTDEIDVATKGTSFKVCRRTQAS